jgi:hypothetical protein
MKATDTHEASPASNGLSVTVFAPAELTGLTVNGVSVSIADGKSEYLAGCGETSVVLEIYSLAGVSVSVNGVAYNGQSIPLTGDSTKINILLTSGDGQHTYRHSLKVLRAIDANAVLYQRWDDVISLIRNPENNDGHRIDSVRWYSINSEEVMSSNWFIRITGYVEEYRAEINVAGNWHHVCGEPRQRNAARVIAYPNPVSVGDNLTLELPDSFAGGYVDVITLSGSTVKRKLPLPGRVCTLSVSDWSPGVYLLHVIGKNGDSETVKVIVNNEF